MDRAEEVARRRTFAIISHPDAGKTTLTEKLLLYGGAVHTAGAVKSRKASRHALSDWMEMEKEKGISITSSVLQFDYDAKRFNLLDTPGHADFSEDTYRVLSAVDSAIMLIDNAKGVEPRTLKLFEVCRLRKLPVMTFVNKLDRPGLDPLELMDQVSEKLDIGTAALNWPIGDGRDFHGVYDRMRHKVVLYERAAAGTEVLPELECDIDDPRVVERIGADRLEELQENLELVAEAGDEFTLERFLAGEVTPFFFGSAMTNFGVGQVLRGLSELAPPPVPRPTVEGERS
ncbi:MAG: GTP-binding protein, partial [Myxococcota bacterium]